MIAYESQRLNTSGYFEQGFDSIEECSGDAYPDQQDAKTQGPWRRELIVGLSMNDRRDKDIREKSLNSPHQSGPVIAQPAQTNENSMSKLRYNSNSISHAKAYKEQNREAIPLRKTDPQKLLTPKWNFYKQNLQDVVLKWFFKIPVFPTMNNKIKLKRIKVINELIDNITELSKDIGQVKYNKKLKCHIETCLDELPMWYPGSKIDRYLFRNNLCHLLVKKIESLNEKWLFIKNEDKSFVNTYDVLTFPFDDGDVVEMLRCEIANWVDTNLKITRHIIDGEIIADILLKRLIPILNSNRNRKEKLRIEIINILEYFSEILKYPKNRTIYFNKLAIDLADRMLGLNYNNNDGRLKIDEVSQRKVLIMKHTDDEQRMSLQSDMESEEMANIHTLSEDSEEERFKEVTDCVYNTIDSAMMRHNDGNSQDIIQDICEALEDSSEFTEDVGSNLANTLENIIKYNDDIHLSIGNQSLSGTLVVLTSEQDFSGPYDKGLPLTSTPLLPEQKKISEKLNCEEKSYIKQVASVVKEWLNTTDMKFDTTDENFLEETIANDIASEVKDLAKLSQLQQNMMMSYFEGVLAFIIMKAILKYGLLITPPNADTPQVVDLKERIKNIGMPDMMQPQHTQEVASIKFKCDSSTCSTSTPSSIKPDEDINKAGKKRSKALADDATDLEQEQEIISTDADQQVKDFIDKYIEQNYNDSDPLARGAFVNLLLQELLKLSPALRNEAYDTKAEIEFNLDKFRRELEYIKEVSDWLKNIPSNPMLTGSDRIEFVNGLAKKIADIEEERINYPGKLDFELMLHGDIIEYLKQLPIPQQFIPNLVTCVSQLRERIARHRPPTYCCPSTHSTKSIKNERDFAKFIEEFLDIHSKEIGDDQNKFEAYIARLLKEIKRIVIEKASTETLTDSQIHNTLADVPMPGNESVQRFSTEMKYAHEISEWLHNFPLITIMSREDVESRMRMISDLAEKMVDTDLKITDNPEDSRAHEELEKYVADWIAKLDLHPNKEIEIPILITQLKNRMENVKKDPGTIEHPHAANINDFGDRPIKKSNNSRRSKTTNKDCPCDEKSSKVSKHEHPGDLIVKAVESWCKNLPIKENDEHSTATAKEKVATHLFQKIGILNVDPRVTNDDPLYEDMLADEVEIELQSLTTYDEISKNKDSLKTALVNKVMDAKKIIKDMSAGENYKQALENTIDASLPNPVHISNKNEPGYELYKNRMAMLWLLENYDYATDFNSMKYKRKLSEELEKYADEAQKRNIIPIEKNEVFNDLFSALYKQQPPKEAAIIDEVQNIKMRCEIDAWFKELPLKKASDFKELLERDQILVLLAKRLYDIEKSKHPDGKEKMQKETIKWLKKLQLLPEEDKNIANYADTLICHLKATEDLRNCKRERVVESKKTSVNSKTNLNKSKDANKPRKENTSQKAGPSRSRPKSCCVTASTPRRKAGELITAAVEAWCQQLPIIGQNSNNKELNQLKDEAVIKVYQILSNLHANPNILNNEGLYEHHLNAEIEKLLSELPGCCKLQQTRSARRMQLIAELITIRPIIKDDLDREGYKQDLKHAITTFFDESTKPNKILVNDNAKDNIIDNFIEYSFHNDDYDDKQIYKLNIYEALAELLLKNEVKGDIDALLTSNKLICEMSKVKPPKQSVLSDEVQEIEMKIIVGELLNEIEIPEHDEDKLLRRDHMKLALARKIVDIERSGQNCGNRQKIKDEITRAFKKLGAEVNPERVDDFVKELSGNDDIRKVLDVPKQISSSIPSSNRIAPLGPSLVLRTPPQSFHQASPVIPMSTSLQSPVPGPQGFMPQCSKTSHIFPKRSLPSPQNVPASYEQSASPDNNMISGPRVAFRQERPVLNGLPNAHLNVPESATARTTVRIQQSQDTLSSSGNAQRNASTDIEADNFNDCKCTRKKRLHNCKGSCIAPTPEYCDECENDRDCELDYDVLYPVPGFIFL